MFLLCLNWVRLLVVGLVLFTLLVVFFSAGFFLGSKNQDPGNPLASSAKSKNSFIPSIHAQNNPSLGAQKKSLQPITFGQGALQLNHKNTHPNKQLSELQQGEPIVSSSRLLREDRAKNLRQQRQQQQTSVRSQRQKPLERPASRANAGVRYYLEVLTDSNQQRAQRITKKLRQEGFRVALHSKPLGDLSLYRIRVGLYATKEAAVRDLKVVRSKKNLEHAFMRTYIPREKKPN